jgi:hypothetical protein
MLREIGLASVILIVLTAVVVFFALGQTADVGFFASGVTDDVALSWGQNAALVSDESDEPVDEAEDSEAESEATEEATEEVEE